VLGKKDIELGVKDRMSVDQFAAAWSSLGVSISPGYVSALFNKYGHNVRGNMPVMVSREPGCQLPELCHRPGLMKVDSVAHHMLHSQQPDLDVCPCICVLHKAQNGMPHVWLCIQS
jgi:hypothetical protein